MAVTTFDGQFSFKQDSLARLGKRDTPKMNSEQYQAFQNSPFMQGVRKTEDLCWTFTCDRDEKRKKTDPSFKPLERCIQTVTFIFGLIRTMILVLRRHMSSIGVPWHQREQLKHVLSDPYLILRHQLLQGGSSCQGPARLQVLGIDEYASQEEVKKDRDCCKLS